MIFGTALSTTCSDNKDFFTVQLDNPISVPDKAVSCKIALFSASIWNSSPNIVKGRNDTFTYYTNHPESPTVITIPQGQYSLSDIQNTLDYRIRTQHPDDVAEDNSLPLFQFISHDVLQKVVMKINNIDYTVDFSEKSSIGPILGFNRQSYHNNTYLSQSHLAENVAKINQINAYLVQSSLVENGIPVNNTPTNILGEIPIIGDPNSQIVYQPFQPIFIQCDNMIGRSTKNLWFKITNEKLEPVINKEDWSLVVVISYSM